MRHAATFCNQFPDAAYIPSQSICDSGCSEKASCHGSGNLERLPDHKIPYSPLLYLSIPLEIHFLFQVNYYFIAAFLYI